MIFGKQLSCPRPGTAIAGVLDSRVLASLALAVLICGGPGQADGLPVLSGPVILTATGLDPAVFPGGQVEFDLAMLKSLGAETITTTSIWTDGDHAFTGVPLAEMIRYLHAEKAKLSLHALNDYAVEIPPAADDPVQAESDKAPILAYEMDGAPMPVRDKGPVWVIYPYDESPIYRTDTVYTRSVWQLDRIDVLR